jgi:hypothetical protein
MGAGGVIGTEGPLEPTCSRAGCTEPATWNVNWRNPRIHPETRVKVWLACDEHRLFLRDYLDTRGFPVSVTPVGVTVDRVAEAS